MVMHLKCITDTNKIVFHAVDLVIDKEKMTLTKEDGLLVPFNKDIEYDVERQYYTVDVSKQPLEDTLIYIFTVPFKGKISTNLYGFYRSSYEVNGKTY